MEPLSKNSLSQTFYNKVYNFHCGYLENRTAIENFLPFLLLMGIVEYLGLYESLGLLVVYSSLRLGS